MDHGVVRSHQSKEENAVANGLRYRWAFQGSLHPSEQDSIIETCPVEHYGELCLPVSISSRGATYASQMLMILPVVSSHHE